MKKEKGEAAFASVDEVLAERIVRNAHEHSEKKIEPGVTPTPGASSVPPASEPRAKCAHVPLLGLVVVACAAALFLLVPLLFLRAGRNRCRKRTNLLWRLRK